MRIKANGITFNYEIEGPAGAPWLVFSNSLATNLSMWDPQAADLSRSFRVLRYDQRGHGGTDAPEGRYAYATLVADALALLDALDVERPHFCGLSMGGATALGLAELHPDRVDRVVVCDSPAMSTPATNTSELRASDWATSRPPYESPQMPTRFGSTSGRDCRYFAPASTS